MNSNQNFLVGGIKISADGDRVADYTCPLRKRILSDLSLNFVVTNTWTSDTFQVIVDSLPIPGNKVVGRVWVYWSYECVSF